MRTAIVLAILIYQPVFASNPSFRRAKPPTATTCEQNLTQDQAAGVENAWELLNRDFSEGFDTAQLKYADAEIVYLLAHGLDKPLPEAANEYSNAIMMLGIAHRQEKQVTNALRIQSVTAQVHVVPWLTSRERELLIKQALELITQ